MAGNAPLEPPDLSQSSSQDTPTSRKRRLREVYAPSAKDQFPDVPWYNLDYQMITDMVHEMLDEIIHGVGRFAATDSGIKGVIDAAEEAKNLPDLEKCCMAVLGEQGAGKSTLITALMGGRKLVEKSGNTKSCTAVPTVIVHKKGADDDTRLSDVTIEWMRPEEWSAHIREQMSRWTDVHPGTYLAEWNAGDATTNETGAQDEDEDKTDDEAEDESDEEVNFSDSDLEEIEEYEQPKSKPRKKKSRKLENAASTAKEFFQTIFNTDENAMARRQLDDKLYNTDIRRGDFEATCIARLTERFRRLGPQLMVRENMSKFLDVSDFDLREKRHLAKKLWPFVKVVTIATGHILLRYGMCFYDLPGKIQSSLVKRSDTNQVRFWRHQSASCSSHQQISLEG
jgi:GTPase SAR1 family protein